MAITDQVRQFVVDNFLMGEDSKDLKEDTSFLEEGIIDSTGVLELVEWLEDEFGFTVDDDELTPENLDNVNCLTDFIIRKT